VFEDDENILLIECKGKALTRSTMSADPGAALLDYASGVVASQVQALHMSGCCTTTAKSGSITEPALCLGADA
jgi:hypothetical protein